MIQSPRFSLRYAESENISKRMISQAVGVLVDVMADFPPVGHLLWPPRGGFSLVIVFEAFRASPTR